MPRTLIVPGVSVEARFDVAPPLPARSGILGCVGVVDRVLGASLQGVTTAQELLELFGPATRYSFPEALTALANGVSEVIVSPVAEGTGRAAQLALRDDEGEDVVLLRARAVGPWANDLAVSVTRALAADSRTVQRVTLEVLHRGVPIERHSNLILRAGDASDLYEVINRDSGTLTAIDPVFQTDLPVLDAAPAHFADAGAATASGLLTRAGATLIALSAARAGEVGNTTSVQIEPGRALRSFSTATDLPSVRVSARVAGDAGVTIAVRFTGDGAGGINAEVQGLGGLLRSYSGLVSVDAIVSALGADPDVDAQKLGDVLPADTVARLNLVATVTTRVRVEGIRQVVLSDLLSAQAVVDAVNAEGTLSATLVGGALLLPDASSDNEFFLSGGRDAGLARGYAGRNNPQANVLELIPAPDSDASVVLVRMLAGTEPNTVRLVVGNELAGGFSVDETWDNLTMDPDNLRYMPRVLQGSTRVRAIDRYPRSRATHFPAATARPLSLAGGEAPALSAWQAAIDKLALEDSVDLMLAGLQGWKDPNLDGLAVQQAMLGHATAQADNARPRIALGSVRPTADHDVAAILAHASQVRDRRFVLVTPAGAEGALAGLLGHLNFFDSPTFKTIKSPGVPLEVYSDSQLNKLVGPDGNVCVIAEKRGRGVICVKGIATDSFQISVTRIADRCIREVKAIADRFIGELNNAEARNALKQMIVATFSQLERDGALVPSVDGSEPAFGVDVYASQNDAAAGIVRVDIRVRPVRAIDYIYATIRVQN